MGVKGDDYMDVILNDSQAIILIPAFQGITFAGDGYEKDIKPLRDAGIWNIPVAHTGKEYLIKEKNL
jgi:hypothetical protein